MDSTNALEDRIRTLCAKTVTAEGEEAEEVIAELMSAIDEREHSTLAGEKLSADYPLDSTWWPVQSAPRSGELRGAVSPERAPGKDKCDRSAIMKCLETQV